MLNEATVAEFRTALRGELVQPADPGYDEARKVYNGMIDKRPRIIARCSDVADVISCVNFAHENEVLLAVRGGGHNGAGWAVADLPLCVWVNLSFFPSTVLQPGAPGSHSFGAANAAPAPPSDIVGSELLGLSSGTT